MKYDNIPSENADTSNEKETSVRMVLISTW